VQATVEATPPSTLLEEQTTSEEPTHEEGRLYLLMTSTETLVIC